MPGPGQVLAGGKNAIGIVGSGIGISGMGINGMGFGAGGNAMMIQGSGGDTGIGSAADFVMSGTGGGAAGFNA